MVATSIQHLSKKRHISIFGAGVMLVSLVSFPMVHAQARTTTPTPSATIVQSPTRTPTAPTVVPSPTMEQYIGTTGGIDATQPPNEWSWVAWLIGFTSNLGSSAVLAIVLYVIITRPREREAKKRRRLQLLGMLKSEFETNIERAKKCIELFEPIEDVDSKPLTERILTGKFTDVTAQEANVLLTALPRFTRGVWNALKESGFITELDDAELIYLLLRTNEATVNANSTRLKLRNKLIEGGKDIDKLAEKLVIDSKSLLKWIAAVLPRLNQMNLPTFRSGDILDEDTD